MRRQPLGGRDSERPRKALRTSASSWGSACISFNIEFILLHTAISLTISSCVKPFRIANPKSSEKNMAKTLEIFIIQRGIYFRSNRYVSKIKVFYASFSFYYLTSLILFALADSSLPQSLHLSLSLLLSHSSSSLLSPLLSSSFSLFYSGICSRLVFI